MDVETLTGGDTLWNEIIPRTRQSSRQQGANEDFIVITFGREGNKPINQTHSLLPLPRFNNGNSAIGPWLRRDDIAWERYTLYLVLPQPAVVEQALKYRRILL